MGWVAFFLALALFVLTGGMLARTQTQYLRLYREQHRSETLALIIVLAFALRPT